MLLELIWSYSKRPSMGQRNSLILACWARNESCGSLPTAYPGIQKNMWHFISFNNASRMEKFNIGRAPLHVDSSTGYWNSIAISNELVSRMSSELRWLKFSGPKLACPQREVVWDFCLRVMKRRCGCFILLISHFSSLSEISPRTCSTLDHISPLFPSFRDEIRDSERKLDQKIMMDAFYQQLHHELVSTGTLGTQIRLRGVAAQGASAWGQIIPSSTKDTIFSNAAFSDVVGLRLEVSFFAEGNARSFCGQAMDEYDHHILGYLR